MTYHRKLRGKSLISSKLDQIIGIGEIRRNRLLKQFGSFDKLAAASDSELRAAGLTEEVVSSLRNALDY